MTAAAPAFLTRLARRALNAPDVRPRLAARFETPAYDMPVPPDTQPIAEVVVPARSASAASPQIAIEPAPATMSAARVDVDAPRPDSAPRSPLPEFHEQRRSVPPAQTPLPAMPVIATAAPRSEARELAPVIPPPPQSELTRNPTALVTRELTTERVRLRREWLTELTPAPISAPPSSVVARPATPGTASLVAASVASMPALAAAAPPPIEIVIGRIEIRAVGESVSPRAKAASARQPALPLADYLRDRERRGA